MFIKITAQKNKKAWAYIQLILSSQGSYYYRMDYSLIIPIYNEKKTLTTLLSQIETLNDNIEIIIINDGSDDGTEKILKNYHNLKIINHSKNLGKGSSLISGVKCAKNKNVIFMDGDLEIKIDCVSNAIKLHKNNQNSIIIGNRWNDKNKKEINFHTLGNIIINLFLILSTKPHTKIFYVV